MDASAQESKRQRRSIGTELAEAREEIARLRQTELDLTTKLAAINAELIATHALLQSSANTIDLVIDRLKTVGIQVG